jgi:uncharacterized protein YlxP (DUF503 family)
MCKVGEDGMNVGVSKVRLQIPENQSLKGKRRVISSMSQRIRNRFGVAVAEVEDNESWQMATLGIACVSGSVRHADEVLDNVIAYIENSREDVVVLDVEQETISGF